MSQSLSRRRFVKSISGVAAGYWVAGRANLVFTDAGIGVGGKGKSDIDQRQ